MTRIDERDLITLNAYLDEQLSPKERTALEQRLAKEPVLQQELDSLRATVALLKRAEPLRAPRNFTLDPKVYGVPQRRRLLDRLGLLGIPQLVTAGGALAATLVCVGLIVYALQGGAFGAATGAPEAAMLEQERMAANGAEQTEEMEAASAALEQSAPPEGEAAEEEAADAALAPPSAEDLTEPPDGDPLYGIDGSGGAGGAGGGGGEGVGGGAGAGPDAADNATPEPTITILQATELPREADATAVAAAPTDGDEGTQEDAELPYAGEAGEDASEKEPGLPVVPVAIGALVIVLAAGSFLVYRARRR